MRRKLNIDKNHKNLEITNDYVFKRLFGYKGNEEITKGLINEILEEKVEELDLKESPILEKDLHDDKVGILDIRARLDNKRICNIEMQVIKYNNIEERILYYWSKLYAGEIKEGEDYKKLNKTIIILIADFILDRTKGIPKVHTEWKIRETEYSKIVLTNIFEVHIIELPKVKKINKKGEEKDKLTVWLRFIKSPESIGKEEMENKEIKKAKVEYDKINQDERERELAELRLKYIRDQNAIRDYGYDRGKEEGIKSEKINIAKAMLKDNIPLKQIIKFTGLSKEEIESLK